MIGTYIAKKLDFTNTYKEVVKICFGWENVEKDFKLENFLHTLKEDLYVFLEFPYVDKLFRDSYYNYFASSHKEVRRNSIRISFFSTPITKNDFFDNKSFEKIQSSYCGYLILRPLNGNLMGRSFISPEALQNHKFICCLTSQRSSIFGLPLEVYAFPHSTQDARMMTCAETSIWSINEYFGNKYSEYALVLPHKIHAILKNTYSQRPLPSSGLTAIQISSALQQLGYAPKMYSVARNRSNENDIFSVISDYVESGIPIVLAVQGEKFGGHAMLLIGHANTNKSKLENLKDTFTDAGLLRTEYVSIDDNRPPYQLLSLNKPMASYKNTTYREAKIISAIVPLYSKMYLEAPVAKKFFNTIFLDEAIGYQNAKKSKWIVRRLLTSSRSFKKWVLETLDFPDKQKRLLQEIELPKFIWIAEYMTIEDYKNDLASVMILLDATGLNNRDSLIFARYPDKYIVVDNRTGKQNIVRATFGSVPLYRNNLKGEWNQWKSN